MKVAVFHPSLNMGGGAERVCLEIIECLKESGHHVVLGTFEKPDWARIENRFGTISRPDEEIIRARIFGMFAYGETLNFHFLSEKMPTDCDFNIISCTSPWFYSPKGKHSLVYMLPPVGYETGLRRMYLSPYIFLQNKHMTEKTNSILLTNSVFSAKMIKNMYSFNPDVLYPPVDLSSCKSSSKEDLIVSTGRFVPFKRFEVLIKSLKDVNEGKCIIMGSVAKNANELSFRYISSLESLISKLNLQDKVELRINSPLETMRNILSRSKIYVHCAMFEHFGISIVEGMASGCVPIVHRSGGAYMDIIENDNYGLSFRHSIDLAEKINSLIKNKDLCDAHSKEAIKRSKIFSSEQFRKRLSEIVDSKKI